jgi:hypothetical protein
VIIFFISMLVYIFVVCFLKSMEFPDLIVHVFLNI